MEYKLSEILKSTILLEGRKEDAMKKYDASQELVDELSLGDPSKNNKYLDWMVKQSMGLGDGPIIPMASRVIGAVTRYHNVINKLTPEMGGEAGINDKAKNNPKDINTYNSVDELLNIVNVAEQKITDSEIKKEVDKIYEDENVLVVSPLTVRSSCKYGYGTKWCIAGKEGLNYNTQFDSYSKHSIFYFITNKNVTQDTDSKHYKYALQYSHNGGQTWWDAMDNSHTKKPHFMNTDSGEKAMKAINDYNHKAVANKLKREIHSFKLLPQSKNYKMYSSYLTEKEKSVIINKIINNEGNTVGVFVSLVGDLTDEQKNDMLTNLVGVNIPSFNSIKNNINKEQLLTITINNPMILNSLDIVKYVDGLLGDDDKYKISKSIDKGVVSNTDSKITLKRWSMTKEERDKHKTVSSYVYLFNIALDVIEKIVKVDPLEPESYKSVNTLRLRNTMDKNVDMYAIRTENGLLDEYVGQGTDDFGKEFEVKLIAKSKKI